MQLTYTWQYMSCLCLVKIHVMFFWVVMLHSNMVGYQCFRGPYYLHLQGGVSGVWKWA